MLSNHIPTTINHLPFSGPVSPYADVLLYTAKGAECLQAATGQALDFLRKQTLVKCVGDGVWSGSPEAVAEVMDLMDEEGLEIVPFR